MFYKVVVLLVMALAWGAPMVSPAGNPGSEMQAERISTGPISNGTILVQDARDLDYVLETAIEGQVDLRFEDLQELGVWDLYVVRQWLGDVRTEKVLEVRVNPETREVASIDGAIIRSVGKVIPATLTEAQAIGRVVDYLERGGERVWDAPVNLDGRHESLRLLKGNAIWWGIGIALGSPAPLNQTHEWFWVKTDGDVAPWVEGHTDFASPEACSTC